MSASEPPASAIPVICDSCRKTGLAGDSDFTHRGDLLEFTPLDAKSKQQSLWKDALSYKPVRNAVGHTGVLTDVAKSLFR